MFRMSKFCGPSATILFENMLDSVGMGYVLVVMVCGTSLECKFGVYDYMTNSISFLTSYTDCYVFCLLWQDIIGVATILSNCILGFLEDV